MGGPASGATSGSAGGSEGGGGAHSSTAPGGSSARPKFGPDPDNPRKFHKHPVLTKRCKMDVGTQRAWWALDEVELAFYRDHAQPEEAPQSAPDHQGWPSGYKSIRSAAGDKFEWVRIHRHDVSARPPRRRRTLRHRRTLRPGSLCARLALVRPITVILC